MLKERSGPELLQELRRAKEVPDNEKNLLGWGEKTVWVVIGCHSARFVFIFLGSWKSSLRLF